MQPYVLRQSGNPQANSPSETHLREGKETSVLRGRRVVIVEDEGITQMLLHGTLKAAGLTVVASALNGEEGVAAVLRERPDLVLMDTVA